MSKKKRARRNPDDETSMSAYVPNESNWMMWAGGAVGAYLLWLWWKSKSDGSSDAGWAAYQARPTKAMDIRPMDRPTFDRLWSSLTPAEKSAGVQWFSLTMEQLQQRMTDPATLRDPANAGFVGKSMAAAFSSSAPPSAAAPPPLLNPNQNVSPSGPPADGSNQNASPVPAPGIGGYVRGW